jgi:hypothetical protein
VGERGMSLSTKNYEKHQINWRMALQMAVCAKCKQLGSCSSKGGKRARKQEKRKETKVVDKGWRRKDPLEAQLKNFTCCCVNYLTKTRYMKCQANKKGNK